MIIRPGHRTDRPGPVVAIPLAGYGVSPTTPTAVPDAIAPIERVAGVRVARCAVTAGRLDVAEYEQLVAGPEAGAVVSFAGTVRNHDAGHPVCRLVYEAHPSAADVLAKVVTDVVSTTGPGRISAVAVGHRIGALEIGETAFAVVVAAAHRGPAFATCARLVNEVKQLLPIWKHQVFANGTSEWVNCA